MTVLDDRSVLATGDKPNNDVYELELPIETPGLTAIRIEALPHDSLPDGGPGRAPLFSVGDFILTEIEAGIVEPDRSEEVQRLKFATPPRIMRRRATRPNWPSTASRIQAGP